MKRGFKLTFLLSITCGLMVIGPLGIKSQQTTAPKSKIVILHVAVSTEMGSGFATGVDKNSFIVISDNSTHELTLFKAGPIPSSICILLDTTKKLSLFDSKSGNIVLPLVTKGLSEFQQLSPETEYSIISIGERPQVLLDWTPDLKSVQDTVGSVELKGRQSAIYDAAFAALEKFESAKHEKRVLVIISGSRDNKSQRKFTELRKAVRDKGWLVYPIGILDFMGPPSDIASDDQWQSEMRQLSAISGGRFSIAGFSDSISRAFASLSLELQRQYLLGFSVPENSPKGEYHKLQIKLGNLQPGLKGLRARSREGYLVD
jgi:VWFA-related protein